MVSNRLVEKKGFFLANFTFKVVALIPKKILLVILAGFFLVSMLLYAVVERYFVFRMLDLKYLVQKLWQFRVDFANGWGSVNKETTPSSLTLFGPICN